MIQLIQAAVQERRDATSRLLERYLSLEQPFLLRSQLWDEFQALCEELGVRLVDMSTRETIGQLIVERQLRFIHEDLSANVDVQLFHRERREAGLFTFFENNSSIQLALRWDF